MYPARLASAWNTVVSAGYWTKKSTSGLADCRRCTSEASVVAPVLVVRSATILKPPLVARSVAILWLSWQNRLSHVNSAMVLRSSGPLRQNQLRPFSVSVGDAHGWHDIGMP